MPDELSSWDARIASLDEHIARLSRYLPRDPEPTAPPPPPLPDLQCPACGCDLEKGLVSVHGTFWGFMLVGMSHQHCWFEPDGGAEAVVVPSGRARRGWRCPGCGFVGIAGGKTTVPRHSIGDV
jgi:hypothetical protein